MFVWKIYTRILGRKGLNHGDPYVIFSWGIAPRHPGVYFRITRHCPLIPALIPLNVRRGFETNVSKASIETSWEEFDETEEALSLFGCEFEKSP